MDGALARMRGKRVAYKIFEGKCGGKKSIGRPRCRWEGVE
jgi:hypothetical protein